MRERAAFAGFLLVAAAAVAGVVWRGTRLPDGPEPIAWDREACAHCRMHISEPGFAAQLILADGRVLDFDDPGCLLAFIEDEKPPLHRAWVHHAVEDRWMRLDDAAFAPVERSPMGYRLAAVDRGAAGTIDRAEAETRVRLARGRADGGHP
ncbi:MAG TPA: hypothetical protein VKE22_20690 [Haliangiales bacterium]|nr:hypothetical protein [Haliangiales bacterium]